MFGKGYPKYPSAVKLFMSHLFFHQIFTFADDSQFGFVINRRGIGKWVRNEHRCFQIEYRSFVYWFTSNLLSIIRLSIDVSW